MSPLDNENAPRLGPEGAKEAAASRGSNQTCQGSGSGIIIPNDAEAGNDNPLVDPQPDTGPIPDTDVALDFLRRFAPKGGWLLVGIDPVTGQASPAVRFSPEVEASARRWIDERQGRLNLYFLVNVVPKTARTKADVTHARALHVDIDPRVGEDIVSERERILPRLKAYDPPPTVIVDSGGGYQGFWLLDQPVAIPSAERAQDGGWAKLEDRNRRIEYDLGADACHDMSRVMRLPGTINVPGAKKRARGRVEALARVVEADWSRTYPLDAFPCAETGEAKADGPSPTAKVTAAAAVDVDPNALPISDKVRALIVQGGDPDDPSKWADRSKAVWHVVCELIRSGVEDDLILGILLDPALGISAHVRDQSRPEPYARRQIERARAAVAKDGVVATSAEVWPPLVGGPMDWAQVYREIDRFLVYHADEWLRWDGHAYRTLTEGEVRAGLWKFLHGSRRAPKEAGEDATPFCPRKGDVDGMFDALKAVVELDRRIAEPCWLDDRASPDPLSVVVCRNGLLDLATGDLLPPSPAFFARSGLAFDYDPNGPEPKAWLHFLSEVWPGDDGADCIAALRRFLGYLLTPDTRYQKALLIVGPTRSGKGVIGRIVSALVGEAYAAAPTLNDFSGSFPLADLQHARVAVISDLRLGKWSDESVIAETLLRVTGEDRVTVGRKYKTGITMALQTRFIVMSNVLPRWGDESGALANRFIVLPMNVSFLGREDKTLTARLLAEAPAILRWAMDGWRKNHATGALAQTDEGRGMVEEMTDLASPVGVFVRERCDLGPKESVGKDALFAAFRVWHEDGQGQPYRGTSATFARDLYAATGGKVGQSKVRDGQKRVPSFAGIGLAASYEVPSRQDEPRSQEDEPPF